MICIVDEPLPLDLRIDLVSDVVLHHFDLSEISLGIDF